LNINASVVLSYLAKDDLPWSGALGPVSLLRTFLWSISLKSVMAVRVLIFLPDFAMPEQPVHLVYPSRNSLSRITRMFIDHCVEYFAVSTHQPAEALEFAQTAV
jgi:DNA-binding transcriptional LysR family regulator